jgi:hypothetical protein
MIGIGIFLLAFMFVFAFIPGLFVPFVSNSDELTMTADRTAALLVDDILALNDTVGVHSGILDTIKINYFIDNVTHKYDIIRTNLGLNMSGDALYSLEVVITYQNGTTFYINDSAEKITSMTGNIGQSKRFVFVRDPTNPNDYPGSMAIMKVRVW